MGLLSSYDLALRADRGLELRDARKKMKNMPAMICGLHLIESSMNSQDAKPEAASPKARL